MQKEYAALLAEIQQNKKDLFWQINNEKESQKTNAILAIQKYLLSTESEVAGIPQEDLISKLYDDIFEYSVLSDPLHDIWVTKISVKAWDDIWIQFENGKTRKIDGFISPIQAEETVNRMLADSGLITGVPYLCGRLKNTNAKITLFRPPAISEGIRLIIKKSTKRIFTEKDYITSGFAVKGELDILITALQYGISILLTGQTGCGITTLTEYLINSLPEGVNAAVLESEHREIASNRELLLSEKEQEDFVRNTGCDILAFNYSTWLTLEAAESIPAVIAQSVGIDPICGIHHMSEDVIQHDRCGYSRVTMRICDAFPLIVYLNKLPDQKRRIMSISESAYMDGRIILTPIWQFQADSVDVGDSGPVIRGHHEQTGEISAALLNRMKLHGITSEEIQNNKRSEK